MRPDDSNPGLNDSKSAGQVYCILCSPVDTISGWDLSLLDLKFHFWVHCAIGCLASVLSLTPSLRLDEA